MDALRTVQAVLVDFLAELDGAPPAPVPPDSQLTDYAPSSVQLLLLHARLEDAFGVELAASALFEHETVAAFAEYVAGQREQETTPCSCAASAVPVGASRRSASTH